MMSNIRQNLRYSGLAALLAPGSARSRRVFKGFFLDTPVLYYNVF